MDNAIDGLQNARRIAKDSELQRKLGVIITDLIKERDTKFSEDLGQVEGLPDSLAISGQQALRQPGDFTRLLEMMVGLGLSEEVDERNFPALVAMSFKGCLFLTLQVLNNRKDRLESLKAGLSPLGFKRENNLDGDETRKKLEEEIEKTHKQYIFLLEQFLASPV